MPIRGPITGKRREKYLEPINHIPEPQKCYSINDEGRKYEIGNQLYPLLQWSNYTTTAVVQLEHEQGFAHTGVQLPHCFLSEKTLKLTSQIDEKMVSLLNNLFPYTSVA